MKMLKVCLVAFGLIIAACVDGGGGSGGGGGGGGVAPTPPTPPGGAGTTVIGLPGFCNVGDTATLIPGSDGRIRFGLAPEDFETLADCGGVDGADVGPERDTKNDEYTFIFFNATAGSYDFQVDEPDNTTAPSSKSDSNPNNKSTFQFKSTPKTDFEKEVEKSVAQNSWNRTAEKAADLHHWNRLMYGANMSKWKWSNGGGGSGWLGISNKNGDNVGDQIERRFPSNVDEEDVCSNTSGIVRAIGLFAKIVVDRDIDYDNTDPSFDCSGSAAGTKLCLGALNRLSDVIDNNIVPLLTELAGDYSDINGDGLFTVFITPRLNEIPITDGDLTNGPPHGVPDHGFFMQSDLEPFDATTNPCSNEEEIIYVHAPDPNGYFNPVDRKPLATYLSADMFGAVTFQLEKLISYNEHVIVSDGLPEQAWLSNALGMMFVDLAGFYAYSPSFMFDLFAYLDIPSYTNLFGTQRWSTGIVNQGFQYLFGKFLLDSQIDNTFTPDANNYDTDLAFIRNLYGSDVGTDNLESNLVFSFDPDVETEFEAMFKHCAIAMVVAGTSMEQGGSSFPYYKPQNTTLYGLAIADALGSRRPGADGGGLDNDGLQNPVGVNLNGDNVIVAPGVPDENYYFENPDQFTYAPGNDFDGFTESFAFNFVRVGGLFEQTSNFAINFSNNNGEGFVVRRPDIDPLHPIVYSESVHGTLDPRREIISPSTVDYDFTATAAPNNTDIGTTLTIVGQIDQDDFVNVIFPEVFNVIPQEVPDIDFYNITIPVLGTGTEGDVAIWVETQVTENGGNSSLEPMLLIASADDVPNLETLTTNGLPEFRYMQATNDPSILGVEDLVDDPDGECVAVDDTSPAPIPYPMTWAYGGIFQHLKQLFVLLPSPEDPTYDPFTIPPSYFEPRHFQQLSLECGPVADELTDADDFIGHDETNVPTNMQEQILVYMARVSAIPELTQAGTEDTLAVDDDSRDLIELGDESVISDFGNNVGGYSVKNKVNGMLQTGADYINPLIRDDIPAGGVTPVMGFNPPGGSGLLQLTPGQTYTIIVAGVGNTKGRYELKLRKYRTASINRHGFIVGFSE